MFTPHGGLRKGYSIAVVLFVTVAHVDLHSAPEEKITLFRSLFRGRDDVYPRRFESRRTGKSGYAPACANEWVRGVCEKPRVKCSDCPHRRFLPLTNEVVRHHLMGCDEQGRDFVAGIYWTRFSGHWRIKRVPRLADRL